MRVAHVVAVLPRRGGHAAAMAAAAASADEHGARLTVLYAPRGLGLPHLHERVARLLAPSTRAREDQREFADVLQNIRRDLPVVAWCVRGSLLVALVRLKRADPYQLAVVADGAPVASRLATLCARAPVSGATA